MGAFYEAVGLWVVSRGVFVLFLCNLYDLFHDGFQYGFLNVKNCHCLLRRNIRFLKIYYSVVLTRTKFRGRVNLFFFHGF